MPAQEWEKEGQLSFIGDRFYHRVHLHVSALGVVITVKEDAENPVKSG